MDRKEVQKFIIENAPRNEAEWRANVNGGAVAILLIALALCLFSALASFTWTPDSSLDPRMAGAPTSFGIIYLGLAAFLALPLIFHLTPQRDKSADDLNQKVHGDARWASAAEVDRVLNRQTSAPRREFED